MGRHSIRDLERITGVKAHTIRIWEQRYGLLNPERTDTNIRYYSSEDLKHLLNVVLLTSDGYKISKISKMSDQEIKEAVISKCDRCKSFETQISMLTKAMIDYDERQFEQVVNQNILQHGFEKAMLSIIFPFFQQVGLLWQAGSVTPAQEHFISNLVRQKIIVAIDGQIPRDDGHCHKYLLFLPEEELHELGLLFSSYLIQVRHNKSIYLGQNTPMGSVKSVFEKQSPDYLMTMITTRMDEDQVKEYVEKLHKTFPDKTIIVAGGGIRGLAHSLPENFVFVADGESLTEFIDSQGCPPSEQGAA